MSEWKEYRLGDVLKIKYGKDHKHLQNGSIPVYGSGGIMRFANEHLYTGPSILIPRKGSLNNIFFLSSPFWTVDTMFWTIIDETIVDPQFLYYYLCRHNFEELNVGSAIPSLTVPVIESIFVRIPPLAEQKKIAGILSALDEKIETNRKINARLEELAQALFKSWFIDFAPFGGTMPEDWKEVYLSDIANIKYGKDHKHLAEGPFPVYGSGGIMRFAEKPLYESHSVLIPRKGSLNNIIFVDEPFWSVDTMFYTEIKRPNVEKFIYLALKRVNFESMNCGSAIPSLSTNILNGLKFNLPHEEILTRFENAINPFFVKIKSLSKESARLAELRDALLPKLMSGELAWHESL